MTSKKVSNTLSAARDFVKEEAWPEAVQVLQRLVNDDDSFVRGKRPGPDGKEVEQWVSVREEANRLLGGLPAAGREEYEKRFGEAARQLLNAARDKKSTELLAQVAESYRHTKAGVEAERLLSQQLVDEGRWGQALPHLDRLLWRAGGDVEPLLLYQAAIAHRKTGDLEKAARTWKALRGKIGNDGLLVANKKLNLADLDREFENAGRAAAPITTEWALFRGLPSRSASGKGGAPYLDEELNFWKQPLIREKQTETWVRQTLSVGNRLNRTMLPGFFPVCTENNIVFRSYFGIHAVDARTGKLVWEQQSTHSIDSLVSPKAAQNAAALVQLNQWVPMYLNSGGLSVLFENSTLGTLSSDGKRVYAVDDLALPPHPQFLQQFMWGGKPNYGSLEDAVNHNTLIAIELETGKLKWVLGERTKKEEKDEASSLKDTFFLGPPLPLDGKLYAAIEKNTELRLVTLEPERGKVLRSQKLADVRDPVSRDVARRLQAVPMASADGILVIPTNNSTIFGVDPLTGMLRWAHSYRTVPAPAEPPAPANLRRWPMNFGPSALRPEWRYSAPIIDGGKVVFTAPDDHAIHCLNLRDGTRAWSASRADSLYLAGVFAGKVVLVGSSRCRALALADGKELWSIEVGTPTGMGAASGNVYYLPVISDVQHKQPGIVAIDLDKGRLIGHARMHKNAVDRMEDKYWAVPGNLVFYQGKVISQNAFMVTAYPQLADKLAEIDQRLRNNPKDAVGLTERGVLRLQSGDASHAREDLRAALDNQPPEELIPKARRFLFDTLTVLLQNDFEAHAKYLDEHKELCRVPVPRDAGEEKQTELASEERRRRLTHALILAKGREQQGNLLEALRTYLEIPKWADGELLTMLDEPAVQARPDVWAHGRIAALLHKADPAKRKQLDDEITRQWTELRDVQDLDQLRRFAVIFGDDFASGREAKFRLAEKLGQESFLEAELMLLSLSQSQHATQAGRAVELLARLLTRKGLLEDAGYWYRRLGRDHAKVVIREGKTGADVLNDIMADKRFLAFLNGSPTPWQGKIRVKEEFGTFQQLQQIFFFEPEGEPIPFFRRHRMAFNLNFYQVKVRDQIANEEHWSQNLNRNPGNNNLQYLYWNQNNPNGPLVRFPYYVNGHMAIFHLGVMVYGLDPVDKKVLWEHKLFDAETRPINQILPNPQGGLNAMFGDGRIEKIGAIVHVSPRAVWMTTSQGLVSLDPIRGTVLWKRTDVPVSVQTLCDGRLLYLIDMRADGSVGQGRAVRLEDGVTVAVPDFSDAYPKRIRMVGRNLLLSEPKPEGRGTTLRLYDVRAGKDVWRKDHSADAVVLQTDETHLLGIAEPSKAGKLTIVDLNTRQEVLAAALDAEDLKGIRAAHLLQDAEYYYVALQDPPNPQLNPWGGPWSNLMNGMRGLMVNGKLQAFDKATGKRKWHANVPGQVLILDQYKDLPILLFTARLQQLVNGGVMQVTATRSLDKRTGKLIYDKQLQNNGTQFHTMNVNLTEGTIDLISFNLRLRHYLEK